MTADPKALEAVARALNAGAWQERIGASEGATAIVRSVQWRHRAAAMRKAEVVFSALTAAGYAVYPTTVLDEPSHEEYRQTLAMVAKLMEAGGPIPTREIPLTFMVCFMDVRRAMLAAASDEGSAP